MAARKFKKTKSAYDQGSGSGGSFKFIAIAFVALVLAVLLFNYRIKINQEVQGLWGKYVKTEQVKNSAKKSAPVGYKKQDRDAMEDLISKEAN